MGMFDNLRVEASLPDPEYQERTFQTKSLECSLSDYTITREGRLVLREVEWEATPEEEMPYYGTPECERGGIVRFFGCMREKSSRDVVLDDFHGDIVFYKTVNAPDDAVFAMALRADAKRHQRPGGDDLGVRAGRHDHAHQTRHGVLQSPFQRRLATVGPAHHRGGVVPRVRRRGLVREG